MHPSAELLVVDVLRVGEFMSTNVVLGVRVVHYTQGCPVLSAHGGRKQLTRRGKGLEGAGRGWKGLGGGLGLSAQRASGGAHALLYIDGAAHLCQSGRAPRGNHAVIPHRRTMASVREPLQPAGRGIPK